MTRREPLITAATITALVTAVIALLVAFGVPMSDDQQAAILGLVAVLAPVVVGLLARAKVTPTADPRTDDGEPLVASTWGTPRH